MDLWSPPHDAPHLLEWWRPLMLVSRRARLDRFPWPVHLDEFRLAGRVRRQGRPDIWIYDHHENGGSVCVDAMGETYRFFATPKGKGVGQFRPCELRSALWRARLPDVVEPVTYGTDASRRGLGAEPVDAGDDDDFDEMADIGEPEGRGELDRFIGPDDRLHGARLQDGTLHGDRFDALHHGGFDGADGLDDVDDAELDDADERDGVDEVEDGVVGTGGRRVVRRGHLTLIAG